jgi:hypothetical protein
MEWLKIQKVWHLYHQPPPRRATQSLIVKKVGRYYSADLTGPLPRDKSYNYIFGIVDVTTKMLYTAPLKGLAALEAKNALEKIVTNNDLDVSVLPTDNGTHFLGDFHEYLESKRIKSSFRTWKTMD